MTIRELEEVSGVGPVAANKLRENFVVSAELLAIQEPNELNSRTSLGEGTVKKMVRNARDLIGLNEERTGVTKDSEGKSIPRLRTGLCNMDEKLMGGFPKGSIIEVYGSATSAKTQFCHQLATMALLPIEKGGLAGNILWITTEDSFRPLIFRMMAHRFGMDPEKALSRIEVTEVHFVEELMGRLPEIFAHCVEHGIGTVVLDSIILPLWSKHVGLSKLRYGLGELARFTQAMRRFARVTGIIFVYTNQVFEKISPYGGYDNAPMGDHVLSHASDYRFFMRRRAQNERAIALRDNAELPPFETTVKLGWGGLFDDTRGVKEFQTEFRDEIELATGIPQPEGIRKQKTRTEAIT